MAASRKPPALLVYLFFFALNLCIFPILCASVDVENVESIFSRSLVPREQSAAAGASGSGDFSCGPDKPCSNKACCGKDGWCGFGDKYCGKGCQSHCDAKADCGVNAAKPGQTCPLNVCCSQYGFCGTTSEFCVGYWEAWNDQHACGKMGIGSIPVNYLTHLIVSFGYIDSNFRVTNMDGLSSDVYRNVGELKARNPGLKIMIALGGWTFNDPGPWQSVFPTMVSSQANRATFIRNLLGFLSEYGYDGVDFDWEYPGAKDRGGSDKDGDNYTALLKELREAFATSGRDYISTFTAPTSYWYLRHFDIKNMSEHVDWINLMSYDLHGVWDGDNPIGKHILSHTNLTEIDLALDLFWRVDVKPSSIVLGLGFYGRSFTLASSSCWKPGCAFTGPGAAGPCTNTAGILSYKEVKDILRSTGATSYLDKEAAARYLVYAGNSWISYDDPSTIQAKIDYANKIGLSGVMIWAIDLDDSSLESLRAVSDPSLLDSVDNDFDLVDLDKLFPKQYLPASGSKPSYGLVTFGGSDGTDPTSSAFGFLLLAGDSHVVSSLRKRDGQPEPFVFLDCPEDILDLPKDAARTARVTCVSGDLEGCYQIMERGVEGTIVEMPDSCAPNQLVRAISLTASKNQSIPEAFSHHQRFSQVFDFSFDFNFKLMRRDSNNTSIRMDYSNTPGYWDQLVDRPGIQSRDLQHLDERFFAPSDLEWNSVYDDTDKFKFDPGSATKIKKDLSAPLYWQTVDGCAINGTDYSEGFGAYLNGEIDASFYYGFSLIGTEKGGSWDAKQSHGFLQVRGQSDMTFGFGGIGTVDVTKAGKGNPATLDKDSRVNLDGHVINAGHTSGLASFQPYYDVTYHLATFNGTDRDNGNPAASFNGRLSARVVSDFGKFQADFPVKDDHNDPDKFGNKRKKDQFELGSNNVLYGSPENGGAITIGSQVTFGLNIEFFLYRDLFHVESGLPNLSLSYSTLSTFTFGPSKKSSDESCAKYELSTDILQLANNAESIGWDALEGSARLVSETQTPENGAQCFKNADISTASKSKRTPNSLSSDPDFNETLLSDAAEDETRLMSLARRQSKQLYGWDILPGVTITKGNLGLSEEMGNGQPKLNCVNCEGCRDFGEESSDLCCGCVNMQQKWGFSDMPPCPDCDSLGDFPDWRTNVNRYLGTLKVNHARGEDEGNHDTEALPIPESPAHKLHRRRIGSASMLTKEVSVCPDTTNDKEGLQSPYQYPAFPKDPFWPWEGIQKGKWDSVSRYWGNTSDFCHWWGVKGLSNADKVWVKDKVTGVVSQVRADYQTEHVFEGQVIGDFFNWWLDKGYVRNQEPMPTNPQPKVPCSWTREWVRNKKTNPNWKIKIAQKPKIRLASFAEVLLSELGSASHLDRLTLFLARPNRKKGLMFTGVRPTSPDEYDSMSSDEQLQEVKEMGMIFNYLNNQQVWDKYCAVYEAIYDHMGDFDTWYATNGAGVTIPNLQKEWKDYNRILLDSMVRRMRILMEHFWNNKE
ncbi:chitinase [Fusarium proliferatum]|uniref:chitinase n=1 Tax=Gibberella intermedia TaxID=948311 RepID=A0A365NBJ0_GIBIN|nr:chitinase [Fusarium proliferatum]